MNVVICIGFLWGSEQKKNRTREGNNLEENLREVDASLDGTIQIGKH
jgi:hypothetical protein